MTISSETNKISYNCNGSTSVFAYTFKILDDDDIVVQIRTTATGVLTTLVKTTDYTVSGVGVATGGNITLVDAAGDAPTGTTIVLTRGMTYTQSTDYNEYDTFPATSHETALDRLTLLTQQLKESLDRSFKLDPGVSGITSQFVGTPTANQVLRTNSGATGFEFVSMADIDAYSFGAGTGILVQSVSGTTALVRTLTGTASEITVTNGDGVSDNPTFSLPTALTFTDKTVTGGTFASIIGSGTWSGNITFSGNNTYSGVSTYSAAVNTAKGGDVASATTTDIGAATGNFVDVTGTTTITGLGTITAGVTRNVRFTGALTLTHNATSLILPGAANITTASNDRATFISLGSGNWICTSYTKATGKSVIAHAESEITFTDITTNNATSALHGYLPKLSAVGTQFLSGLGTFLTTPSLAVVTVTRDLTTATGSVAYTGAGFTPRYLIAFGAIPAGSDAMSIGYSIGTSNYGQGYFGTTKWVNTTGWMLLAATSTANYQTATVTSLDADGFTLSWAKNGTPTGSYVAYVLCIK